MPIENNVSIKSNSNLAQTSNTTKPQQYKVNPNAVDKTPDKDTVQLTTGQKAGIGVGILAATVGLFFLFRGKKPATTLVKQAEQVIPRQESPKMEMTEEAKKVYDKVASKLHKKSAINQEIIDKNLAPKSKKGSWDSKDMKEYYLEQASAEKSAKEAAVKTKKGAEIQTAKEVVENVKSAKVTQNGNITIIEEPLELVSKSGSKTQAKLIKEEVLSDGIFGSKRKEYKYTIYDNDAKRIAECDGMIETRGGKKVLNGHGIQSFKRGLGLGTKLKEVIKSAAKENGCESINIEAAYGSHMFHNKMGYKVNYGLVDDVTSGKNVLKRMKTNNKLQQFTDRINDVLTGDNTRAQDVNNLLDEILSFANSKGFNSKDISILGTSIPMTYKL